MNVAPVVSPLPGEHLIATAPRMRPDTDARWRQRLNFWSGRSLTAEALELDQENRAARLAWQGRLMTPGIISGLEIALEEPSTEPAEPTLSGYFLHVATGSALAATGEDAVVTRPLRVPLDAIPVQYVRVPRTTDFPAGEEPPAEAVAPERPELQPRLAHGGLDLDLDTFPANHIPWAAVLVLRPIELRAFGQLDPNDPCELDPSRDPFADERRIDAAQLRFCQLPVPWETLPLLADRSGPTWRNRLAHAVFLAEAEDSARQQLRLLGAQPGGDQWDAVLRESGLQSWELTADAAPSPLSLVRAGGLFPWELLGVPLALFSSEQVGAAPRRRFFFDRSSVVRPGGRSRSRSRPAARLATAASDAALNPPGAGTGPLWRARVDQFAEHLASLEEEIAATQAAHFQFFPPAGLLPRGALRLLTTTEANNLGASDRADHNEFFPAAFRPEAVPIPTEDLDAALASSAALSPLDRNVAGEPVRILVPLPERLFDPNLLVVEAENPFFATETARLAGIRQDWRQRRDFVRVRRDALRDFASGPLPPAVTETLEPGQLEAEPTEVVDANGVLTSNGLLFQHAWVSPGPESGIREITPQGLTPRALAAGDTLFLFVRIDVDSPPERLDVVCISGAERFRVTWVRRTGDGNPPEGLRWLPEPSAPVSPPPLPGDPISTPPPPQAGQMWFQLEVTSADVGGVPRDLTGLQVRVEGGRIALGPIGTIASGDVTNARFNVWYQALPASTALFGGGDWTRVSGSNFIPGRLLAPFEDAYDPSFDDDLTLDARLTELDTRLRLPDGERVRQVGLRSLIDRLQREVDQADDAIDLNFLKAQSNAHRARQVIMGEDAANELLTSPILNSIVESKSARVVQDKLLEAFKAVPDAQTRRVSRAGGEFMAAPSFGGFSGGSTVPADSFFFGGGGGGVPAVAPGTSEFFFNPPGGGDIALNLGAPAGGSAREFLFDFPGGVAQPGPRAQIPSPDDVHAADPLIGQSFRIRTLSFAKRFNSGPALSAYEFAHAGFLDALGLIRSLPLTYDQVGPAEDPIPDIFIGPDTPVTDQQPVGYDQYATSTDASLPIRFREQVIRDSDGNPTDDPSAIVGRAIRRADAAVLILRRLEYYTARRREQLERAREDLNAVIARLTGAQNRLVPLDGELTEARHDVSVARALWQEERQRVFDINTRRDGLIATEVKFLAFVRPRSIDLAWRKAPGWKLDSADAPQPLPACLRRHDEPDPALQAYVDLFRHSPARWFTELAPLLAKLDTRERLFEVLETARFSATRFVGSSKEYLLAGKGVAALAAYTGQQKVIAQLRQRTAQTAFLPLRAKPWTDFHRDATEHATVGDLIDGGHGQNKVSTAATAELGDIAQVATCLHAEFAAVPPALRLAWVERYSQFDKPGLLRDLTVLPQYGRLERGQRRRLQEFVSWLFSRVSESERDAVNLMNDFVRLCLLLASHAPVNQIIAGHLPRPTPVRPGVLIPIKPLNPQLVRVGMEFQVWHAQNVVARGVVQDLQDGEVRARVDHVAAQATTLDTTMQVRFVPAALSLKPAVAMALTLRL